MNRFSLIVIMCIFLSNSFRLLKPSEQEIEEITKALEALKLENKIIEDYAAEAQKTEIVQKIVKDVEILIATIDKEIGSLIEIYVDFVNNVSDIEKELIGSGIDISDLSDQFVKMSLYQKFQMLFSDSIVSDIKTAVDQGIKSEIIEYILSKKINEFWANFETQKKEFINKFVYFTMLTNLWQGLQE